MSGFTFSWPRFASAVPFALTICLNGGSAVAECATTGSVTSCTVPTAWTQTVGTGPNDAGHIVNVGPNAAIDTTDATAISIGNNGAITLQSGAIVRGTINTSNNAGNYGTGLNVVEFNSNTRLLIQQGASIIKLGTSNNSEAVNPYGFGNTIENHGLIQSTGSSAIWFENTTTGTPKNVIDNHGTIEKTDGGSVIGARGDAGIAFINRAGATVKGDILLSAGDDDVTLFAGSSVSGRIDGGGGANSLRLDGAAATAATLADNVRQFQTLTKAGGGRWTIASPSNNFSTATVLAGELVAGNTNVLGSAPAMSVASGATFNAGAFNQTLASLANAGTVRMGGQPGTTLTVTGNYSGQNGNLAINTVLGNDASATDRLVIQGNSSGQTRVSVTNIGGTGAPTVNGIRIVSVGGTSVGQFTLNGSYVFNGAPAIVAGAFSYQLFQNPLTGMADGAWYLRSTYTPPPPPPPVNPPPVTPPPPVNPPPVTPPPVTPPDGTGPGGTWPDPTWPGGTGPGGTGPGGTGPGGTGPGGTGTGGTGTGGTGTGGTGTGGTGTGGTGTGGWTYNPTTGLPGQPWWPYRGTGPIFQPGVPLYEAYPQMLGLLNDMPTLQQRVGNRAWTLPSETRLLNAAATGPWLRVEGRQDHLRPAYSMTGVQTLVQAWALQAGIDALVHDGSNGALVAGINGRYGQISGNVRSVFGGGDVALTAAGIGATLTWYGSDGFYADAQAHHLWHMGTMTSAIFGQLNEDDVKGRSTAASLELGRMIKINENWSLTPQLQVIYGRQMAGGFTDPMGAAISFGSGERLTARAGLAANYHDAWTAGNGTTSRVHLYGLVNMYHDLIASGGTEVSGFTIPTARKHHALGVALGGSYSINNDALSLYGELSYKADVFSRSANDSFKGTAGLRVRF